MELKCTAFETGGGVPDDWSDDEKQLPDQTTQDCIRNCIKEKKNDDTINGVTVQDKNDDEVKKCSCERNMVRVHSGKTNYKTCFLVPKAEGIHILL